MALPLAFTGIASPGGQAIIRYARQSGAGGKSAVLGPEAPLLHPPFAALVNGALAHSFKLDAGTKRGVGAHPFGTVLRPHCLSHRTGS